MSPTPSEEINDASLLLAAADALLSCPFPSGVCAAWAELIRSVYHIDAVTVVLRCADVPDGQGTALASNANAELWIGQCRATLDRWPELDRSLREYVHIVPLPHASEPIALLITSAPICMTEATRRELGRWLRLRVQLHKEAALDSLTGLLNRAQVEERVQRMMSGARRHGRKLVAMLMDLDEFKQINDQFGHPVGDLYLQSLAASLRLHVRGADEIFRIGGDEFLILLPDTSLAEGIQVAQRIRELVAGLRPAGGPDEAFSSISIGLAETDGTGTWEKIRTTVDRALYRAKRSGGDCVMS